MNTRVEINKKIAQMLISNWICVRNIGEMKLKLEPIVKMEMEMGIREIEDGGVCGIMAGYILITKRGDKWYMEEYQKKVKSGT